MNEINIRKEKSSMDKKAKRRMCRTWGIKKKKNEICKSFNKEKKVTLVNLKKKKYIDMR